MKRRLRRILKRPSPAQCSDHYWATCQRGDFQGYIHQVGEDVRISFWGYDENAWQFIPGANQCIQPDDDPMIMVVHKMPQIQSFIDADGCVVIQASTTAAEVTSRVCE